MTRNMPKMASSLYSRRLACVVPLIVLLAGALNVEGKHVLKSKCVSNYSVLKSTAS